MTNDREPLALEPESSHNGTLTSLINESSVSPATRLFAALNDADMVAVNALLDRHPEAANERDEEGRVPLHYAADCADSATFHRTLDAAPTLIDAEDSAGLTPLLIAVMSSHLDALRLLISRGSRLSHVDHDGHTCVHWAVVCGEFEALTMLLRAGARVDVEDIYGARPLHYSTVIEDTPMERAQSVLHALLKDGAEVDARDSDGRTPLLWAASNGNVEAFKSLVQAGADKHAVDRDRLGVLHCAASNGHVRIIQRVLASSHRGVVSMRDCNGDTPLLYAATFGHYECARVLLEGGADPNHLDRRLRTAAHCAAAKGHLRLLKLLKQYGASFEFQNYRGDLPFHEAVQTGSKELVDWLLQIEPKFLSTPNFYGRTALHLASAAGNMELVVLLCTRGATVNPLVLYHEQLYTPLDLSLQRDHQLVADYLRGRHEALRAEALPDEKTERQRASIVEQLKTAKLRKARAQAQSTEWEESDSLGGGGGYTDEEDVFDEQGVSVGRKGQQRRKSRRGRSRNHRGGQELANYDKTSLQSRRSSSASEMRPRRERQTSSAKRITGKGPARHGKPDDEHSLERKLAQEAIEKIVREELRKAAELSKSNGAEVKQPLGENIDVANCDEAAKRAVINTDDEGDGQQVKKIVKVLDEEPPTGTESGGSAERIKKRKKREQNTADEKDGYTELHIIGDGWEQYEKESRTPGRTAAERRFVHEKSIFEELTHLKRMQIQYVKVQEKLLVRSLANNFCKTHGLNPAHFRFTSLLEWEKFLYDQLKMIYLEERSRIQAAAGAPRMGGARSKSMMVGRRQKHPSTAVASGLFSGGRFDGARANKPSLLDDRLRELSRIYTSSSSMLMANGGSGAAAAGAARSPMSTSSGAARRAKDAMVGGQKRCECLGKHLLLK